MARARTAWWFLGTVPQFRTLPALAFLTLLVPTVATAAPTPKHPAKKPTGLRATSARLGPVQSVSKSIGSPTDGHLANGVHLAEGPYWRITPSYREGDARWGTDMLVGLIERAGKSVRAKFPDAVLSVGHLSKKGGGEIDRHASHESGRDADLGFYVKNQQGKPIYADHFVAFEGDGKARSWPGAQFDDARNWALVAAIAGDGRARVTHIFVATPIRARLLSYAEKIGAPPNIRNRAAELMAQPRGSLPHDDHFHVRIGCPSTGEQCIELPVRHPKHGAASASHRTPTTHPHATATGHAAPHASNGHGASAHAQPKPAPSKPKDSGSRDDKAASNDTPSLAQPIPGLDSAVIPAPLAKPTWGTAKEPSKDPISDPDGVTEPAK